MSIEPSKSVMIAVVGAIAMGITSALFQESISTTVKELLNHYFPQQPAAVANPSMPAVVATAPVPPAAFQINYLYRAGGSGPLRPILPGSVLHSGDSYKIIFTPHQNGYVYLFQLDSAGQFFQLFPMTEFKGVRLNNLNPVTAGQRYELPGVGKVFKLDRTVGQERLFLAITTAPNDELANLGQRLATARNRNATQDMAQVNQSLAYQLEGRSGQYEYRGPESVETDQVLPVTWDSGASAFKILGRKLENLCTNCVYGTEFEHR